MKRLFALFLSLALVLPLIPTSFAVAEAAAPSASVTSTFSFDPSQTGPVALAMQLCNYTVNRAVQSANDAQTEPSAIQTATVSKLDNTDLTILANAIIMTMISITHEIIFD